MAIANGRNNMLASIEDSAFMLNSLVDELDRFYSNKLTDFERKIDLLRIENKNEEPKVLCSMCSDWNYAISIYDELFTETKEMLICKVYSYAEKHMNKLLSMLGYNHNKISKEYKDSILPSSNWKRLIIEAGSRFGWGRYIGLDGAAVTMTSFGASAPAKELFEHFGFTAEHVAQVARSL